MLFCTFEANAIISKTIVYVFETCSRSSPLHLTLYPAGLINHVYNTPRNNVKPAMVVGNFLKIFAQARSLAIMNEIVNLEGMVVGTHL